MFMSFPDFTKSILSRGRKEDKPIIVLAIEEDFAQSCVFKVAGEKVEILAFEQASYQKEEILSTLTSLLQKLIEKDENWHSLDIVFGLPFDWIEEGKIKEPYEDLVNRIASSLALNSLAFVSIPKALAFLIAQEEKTKFTGFLIGFGEKSFILNLLKNGEVEKVERILLPEENYGRKIQASIFSFGADLPSRIVLFGFGNLANIKDALSNLSWQPLEGGSIPFLHPPRVELLEQDTLPLAVAFAAAVDLGLLSQPQELFVEAVEKKEKDKTSEKDQFGFVYGQDVFGGPKPKEEAAIALPTEEFVEEERQGVKKNFFPLFLIQNFFQFPFLIWQAKKGRLFLIAFLLPVFLFVLLFAFWWIVPSAKVGLSVYSKVLDKDVQVEVDPLLVQTNLEEGKIVGQAIEVKVSDSQKGLTSGKKIVGERAKGEVTIFNKTSAPRTFAAGTVIAGGDQRFTLGSQVSVASRSATVEGITYGKNKVDIIAQDIGEKGNLEAGLDFSIADFDQSLYSAHNDGAFAGGSQREINVISQEDKTRLADSLGNLLLAKAKEEIKSKLSAGWKIEESAITPLLVSQKFDKETGEEAQILNLSQEVKFTTTAFKEEDLRTVLEKRIAESTPQGYEIQVGASETKTEVAKISPQGILVLEIKIKANIIPKFDTKGIARNLVGKRPDAAKNYLLSLPEVFSANVFVQPPLPAFAKTMPHLTSRIKIETSSQPGP
jgi:hypothetical protein